MRQALQAGINKQQIVDKVLFGIQLNLPVIGPVQHITSGYPGAYQELYRDHELIGTDPTVAHCLTRTDPLEWSERMYSEKSIELLEESPV